MTRYKTVGIVDLFLGTIDIIYSLFIFLFTLPKLNSLYSEFSAESSAFNSTSLVLILLLLMGMADIFFGVNLVSNSEKKVKYFKFGLVFLIINLLLVGIFYAITSLSIIIPIYQLTSSF